MSVRQCHLVFYYLKYKIQCCILTIRDSKYKILKLIKVFCENMWFYLIVPLISSVFNWYRFKIFQSRTFEVYLFYFLILKVVPSQNIGPFNNSKLFKILPFHNNNNLDFN